MKILKNKSFIIICIIIVLALCLAFVACGEEEDNSSSLPEISGLVFSGATYEYDGKAHSLSVTNIPEGATVKYFGNECKDVGIYDVTAIVKKDGYRDTTLNAKLEITLPSAQTIVNARATANEANEINYDFSLNLSGTATVVGYSGKVNANYDAKYRYNKTTGDVNFLRETSGILLYEGSEYIISQGNSRVLVKADENGDIKKVQIAGNEEENVTMINLPIAALIDALKAENLTNIKKSTGKYKFEATLTIDTNNPLINKLLGIVGKQGLKLSFKGVSFTNPVGGLKLYFDLDEKMSLTDFAIGIELSVPVKGIPISISLSYAQNANDSKINLPNVSNVIYGNSVASEMEYIKNAFTTLKNSSSYSLDLTAENEFDPGWNVTATKDKYNARMYKNTYELNDENFVAFNHSYEYKTHTNENGAETFKQTIGNVTEDNKVYLITRYGKNTQTELNNVNVNTQFDYLVSSLIFNTSDVDCIRKTVSGGVSKFEIYLNNAAARAINAKVTSMINSNNADDVIPVDNYFNEAENDIQSCILTITIKNGAISKVEVESEIKYMPTAGEHSDKNITLIDRIELSVNDNISKATDYTAPKRVNTVGLSLGLNNAKYYID